MQSLLLLCHKSALSLFMRPKAFRLNVNTVGLLLDALTFKKAKIITAELV